MKWWLFVLLCLLPLQWFVVLGPLRLHEVAMLVFLIPLIPALRWRAYWPVLSVGKTFIVANTVLCAVWVGTNLYNGLGFGRPIEQMAFLAVGIGVGTVVFRLCATDGASAMSLLRWAGLATSLVLLGALSFSMATNGVNPAAVFAKTIGSADPEVLQKELFKSAFAGFGIADEEVKGNIRHEVFGAVFIATCVSHVAAGMVPFTSRAARNLFRFATLLAVGLIVVSMSRSLMIAAAAWPLMAGIRALLAGRVRPAALGAALVAGLLVVATSLAGLLDVVWVRFTQDTSSYEARDGLLTLAYTNIMANPILGGVETANASSHNFVLDTWLRAGVFAALAALAALVVTVGLWLSLIGSLHRHPAWLLPATAMLTLPIVRMLTAGGGLIPPVQWVALGIVAGLVAFLRFRQPALDADRPRVLVR